MKISLKRKTIDLGDDVKVDIEPANVGDYQALMGYFANFGGEDGDTSKILERLNDPRLLNLITELIPKYAKDLQGLTIELDDVERVATVADLTEYGAFLNMTVEILSNIINISTVGVEEEKTVKK